MTEIKRIIFELLKMIMARRKAVLGLSCLVVFITTYLLILPAFTLEKNEAARQGGIDVPGVETTAASYSDSAEDADGAKSADESDMSAADEDIEEQAVEYSSEESLSDEESAEADDPDGTTDDADSEEASESEIISDETADSDADSDAAAAEETEEVLTQVEGEDAAAEETDAQAEDMLTFEGDGYTVSVEDPHSVLPADTELVVDEILEKAEEGSKAERESMEEAYKDYCEQAITAINDESGDQETKTISFAKLYDIRFMSSGEEINPDKPLNVTISYDKDTSKDLKVAETDEVRIVHFAQDDKTEEVTAELLDRKTVDVTLEKSRMTETTFEAESFSVYAVVYTVDFEYVSDVDGKTYEYSIRGGDGIGLSELLPALDVIRDDKDTDINEVDEFIGQIAEAGFSDPELVSVSKADEDTTIGAIKDALGLKCDYSADLTEDQITEINSKKVKSGDWALISLRAFDTEETLTVTLKNGDEFTVKVTDAQISTHVITADGDDYIITVTYGPEAGIPDGAKLTAVEIPSGCSEYEKYLKQSLEKLGLDENCEATDQIPWTVSVPMARFFDISIISDGEKIEPKASVSVEIAYVGKENAHLGAMSVVHFAESGLEIIDGTMAGGEELTSVTFEQSSFSVTGTIINSANLSEDNYYILKESNGRWYALASDGSTVDVTNIYDPSSASVVNYQGAKNITWEVSFTDWENDGGNGWYFIKAKDEDKYISLNGSIVSGNRTYLFVQGTTWANDQGIWINYWSKENGGGGFAGPPYIASYHHMLSWHRGSFSSVKNETKREYSFPFEYLSYEMSDSNPTEVRFARVTGDSEVVNSNYPNNTYNEAQIQAWLDQAMTDKPLQEVNKKASLYDYDNRIYQIDFSARSGVTAMAADLSMAFVADVSNSMLFPSSLTAISGKTAIDLKSGNLDSLPHSNGEVYFTIADAKASSTVYALYYDNGWKGMDSSYYAKWKAGVIAKPDGSGGVHGTKNREKTINATATYLHDNDTAANNTKYTIYNGNSEWMTGINHHQIYDMSDNGQYGLQPDGSITSYNMGNRLYYLESSVASAVNDMQIIAKEYPLGEVYAGLETFAMDVEDTKPYLKIGGYNSEMDTANATYRNNVQSIFNALKDIKGKDGTDQRDAFDSVPYIGNGVTLPNGTNKYVILITDGAPNYCTKEEAIASANALKQAGYTIITVGLSTKDVSVAPEMLWKSASFVDPDVNINSEDKSKPKYYYYAENGEDLKWILRDIVRNAMGQATVTSTVTDTIDPLFYPVDKDGDPFPQTGASYIKKDGSRCSYGDPGKVGKVEYIDNNWVVTWENQDIPWEGWNSSVFVKAKEDFLGGNTVSTNIEASFRPESYTTNKGKSNEKTAYFTETQKTEKTAKPATPYVNVDELKLTKNDTTFTVYLGEEVTPADEIRKLWNSIVVNTVVHKDGMQTDYSINSKDTMYYDPDRSNKLTRDENPLNVNKDPVTEIPLSHYINNAEDLINDLLSQLKDGQTETSVTSAPIDYAPYGQDKVGTITVTLTKRVNEEAKTDAPDTHETKKVVNPAETYTLTVQYTPLTGAERKQLFIDNGEINESDMGYMHNGDNGPGKEVNPVDDEVKSVNTHKIIVFAKGLQITKTDEMFDRVLTGAKFELYRTARVGEEGQKELDKVSGKYIKIADLDTSANGIASLNPVKGLRAAEKYYLVETEAPAGYNMIDHPLEVLLDVENHYYPSGTTEQYMRGHDGTSAPEDTLYNWMQKAKLTIAEDSAVRRTNPDGTGDLTHEGFDSDSDTMMMYYSISNNPGVELPHTGGIGTVFFYILGSLLVMGCGALLISRRRASRDTR